jgi:hypothetical protein
MDKASSKKLKSAKINTEKEAGLKMKASLDKAVEGTQGLFKYEFHNNDPFSGIIIAGLEGTLPQGLEAQTEVFSIYLPAILEAAQFYRDLKPNEPFVNVFHTVNLKGFDFRVTPKAGSSGPAAEPYNKTLGPRGVGDYLIARDYIAIGDLGIVLSLFNVFMGHQNRRYIVRSVKNGVDAAIRYRKAQIKKWADWDKEFRSA